MESLRGGNLQIGSFNKDGEGPQVPNADLIDYYMALMGYQLGGQQAEPSDELSSAFNRDPSRPSATSDGAATTPLSSSKIVDQLNVL